jgi:NitT/TauT family transport system substrate-binding protein
MMSNRQIKILALATLIGLNAVLCACSKSEENPPEQINFRLKWLFNISVVGDLWADVQGYFSAKGLNVSVKPGGPERDAIKELELGHAQFGVASADQVIRAKAKGSPIVVLAQVFQVNPLQWIYRPEKTTIESAEDLRGKVIGITYGGNDEAIMRALLTKHGIRTDEVTFFSVRYDYTPFYTGKVELWPVYRNAQGVLIRDKLQSAGEKIEFFDPDRYGIRFVANSVITTEKMISNYPETVEKFVQALLSAWKDALDPQNSDKAVEVVHRFDQETSKDMIRKQLEITRFLASPGLENSDGASEIGRIDAAAWMDTEKIMISQRLISSPVQVERYLKSSFEE